jgi:hypothetical protein
VAGSFRPFVAGFDSTGDIWCNRFWRNWGTYPRIARPLVPLSPPAEFLWQTAELLILAGKRALSVVELKEDKLMLTRHGDFITLKGVSREFRA